MEQTKRHRDNSDNDNNNNKRQKSPISTTTDNGQLITCFEDLSNDLFYEIFDYLDHYDIYQAFLDLNKRFIHLLIASPYPLEINLSAISKSKYIYYYNLIIYLNKQRIRLFRITNSFLANQIFKYRDTYNNYCRLEKLILENILSEHIENILISVKYNIPKLSSLTIDIINEILLPGSIYSKIYSISTLNYCKLTFKSKYDFELFSIYHRELSSIKYFILNTSIYLQDLDLILSYLPNLCYLSINYLDGSYSKRKKTHSSLLSSLNKLNLKLRWVDFNQFKQLIIDYFSSIESLYLSIDNDQTYLHAQQWEQLITNHMTNLKVFDLQHTSVQRTTNFLNNHHLMEEFFSSFWIERQWFFNNQHEQNGDFHSDFFYSINPYRRHDYTLYWQRDDNCGQNTYFNKVNELCISGTQKINSTNKYFPNVIKLTFDTNFILSENSIINLSNIRKLIIKRDEFPLKELIRLLSVTNHLYSLKVSSLPSDDVEDENELFKKVSNTNMVKILIIDECCTLQKVQLLMNLFPRLKELISQMNRKEFLLIMKFLLTKTKDLCFICVLNAPKVSLREVKKLIKDMKIINVYEINYINRKLYLWW